jgi:hypothetical protein
VGGGGGGDGWVGGVGASGPATGGAGGSPLPPPQAPSADSSARLIVICNTLLCFVVNMVTPFLSGHALETWNGCG